jgi:hypothetical protein
MHLIERYATSTGLKIDKPFIFEKFYPLPVEKYISFQPFSKYNSKNYDYWDEVISLIKPILDKNNIFLVQIGSGKDKPVGNCINLCGQTKISQASFIIKNALMHVGADSFGAHVASGYNKKIVALYSNNNINNVKPYWTKDEDMVLLKPEIKNKPNYSAEESPKNINKIKPELIAKSILKLLGFKDRINFNTTFVGEKYGNLFLESVPSMIIPNNIFPDYVLNIRFDYIKNIEELDYINTLNNLNIRDCIIITDKPLKIEKFYNLKDKIKTIFYDITFQNIDFEFIKKTKILGIKLEFIFHKTSDASNDLLNHKKLELIEYPELINVVENSLKPIDEIKTSSYYKSRKIIFANNNIYLSKAAFLENKPAQFTNILDTYQDLKEIKNIDLLIQEDSDFCLFYNKI